MVGYSSLNTFLNPLSINLFKKFISKSVTPANLLWWDLKLYVSIGDCIALKSPIIITSIHYIKCKCGGIFKHKKSCKK